MDLVEYNGAARDIPDAELIVSEVRIGSSGRSRTIRSRRLGKKMLNGAQLAIDEANAAGGYGGKPFKLMLHNDYFRRCMGSRPSNEVASRWWMLRRSGLGDLRLHQRRHNHIALRASLKAEIPIVNSASTDPTISETIIPWYFTDLQDDRVQCYTLARHIYTEPGTEARCHFARERPLRTLRGEKVSRCVAATGPSRGDRAEVLSG